MQRLVYTPKIYAYTKRSDGEIIDISRYVVQGNINRRINAVSSATLTLRNPKMIFTTPDAQQRVTFSPMDPITIFLQRMRGHSVRVFTGYLDRTPYLQLYPGVINLQASCTLKKLLHTYFDPGLPYTVSFFTAYGWIPGTNGVWSSREAMNDWKSQADGQVDQNDPDPTIDSSISNLLFATMQFIGRWNKNDILIEKLPKDLFTRLAYMSQQFEKNNKSAYAELEGLMGQILGEGEYGSEDEEANGPVGSAKGGPERYRKAANAAGARFGIDPSILMSIAETESGFGVNMGPSSAGAMGPMQFLPSTWAAYKAGGGNIMDVEDAMMGAAKYLKASGAPKDYRKAIFAYNHDNQYVEKILKGAKKYGYPTEAVKTGGGPEGTGRITSGMDDEEDVDKVVRASGSKKGLTASGSKVYPLAKKATRGGSPAEHRSSGRGGSWQNEGWDLMVPIGTDALAVESGTLTKVHLGTGALTQGWQISLAGDSGENYFYNLHGGSKCQVKTGQKVEAGTILGQTGSTNGPHLHFSVQKGWPGNQDFSMLGLKPGEGQSGPAPDGTGNTDMVSGNGNQAAAGAFFGTLNLPSTLDVAQSMVLGGEKSLMNDKPLMPFIQQLCEASLRQFQSTPDGKFFAFYPDYFGEMNARPPYWEIDDIEVLDGSVNLSDDALVTHMYVVGDTINPMGSDVNVPDIFRSVLTSGVVTVFNAFLSDDLLDRADSATAKKSQQAAAQKAREQDKKDGKIDAPGTNDPRGLDIVMDMADIQEFLNRYGARPHTEDMPMIKHAWFEMFLAYQRFMLAWSKQFESPFLFTFMPELYPGGKVGFPDHGLQMYIEEVTHNFDYEGGFTTEAVLSAPSRYGANTRGLPPNMVKALIEPVGARDKTKPSARKGKR